MAGAADWRTGRRSPALALVVRRTYYSLVLSRVEPVPHRKRSTLDVASRYGFRRIEHLYITSSATGSTATVTGVAHRYPCSVRVPLDVAVRLIAAGVPMTVERDGECR